MKTLPSQDGGYSPPTKTERFRANSRSQDEKKLGTILPSLVIPGGGLRSRSQANSGRSSPRNGSQSPGVNFEFCKTNNELGTPEIMEFKPEETITVDSSSPPRSNLIKKESKGKSISDKINILPKSQISLTNIKPRSGYGIQKTNSTQQIISPGTSHRTTTITPTPSKPTSSIQKSLTKLLDTDKSVNPYNPSIKTSATPQNKSNSVLGIKPKLLKTDVKEKPEKEKEKPIAEKKTGLLHMLSDEERYTYGDRFPTDYAKVDFLGR